MGVTLWELPCKRPEVSFGKKVLMKNFFFVFIWRAEKVWTFGKKTGRFVKTAFKFSTGTIRGKKLTCFRFFGAWTDFFTNSGQKPGQVCRNCIVGGQRSLFNKTSVSGKANSLSCFWFRIFSVRSLVYLQKKHRQFVICQKWIPSLHRNNLRTKKLKNFSCDFSDFRRNQFKILSNYLVANLSELPCNCPE